MTRNSQGGTSGLGDDISTAKICLQKYLHKKAPGDSALKMFLQIFVETNIAQIGLRRMGNLEFNVIFAHASFQPHNLALLLLTRRESLIQWHFLTFFLAFDESTLNSDKFNHLTYNFPDNGYETILALL